MTQADRWTTVPLSWTEVRGPDGLLRVSAALAGTREDSAGLHLDFQPLAGASAERASMRWLAAMGNVILNFAGPLPLRVTFPSGDPGRLLLYRSGLLYALARHERLGRPLAIEGFGDSRAFNPWLRLWSVPWRPGGLGMDGRLLDDEPRAVDTDRAVRDAGALVNRSNAKNAIRVIIDPHRREKSVVRQSASMGLARGWIGAVLPGSRNDELVTRRRLWKDVVTQRILTEALDNVTDHAFVRPEGARSVAERDAASYVTMARTDGGGDESAPRLHLVVADNGYGVVTTLRAKLAKGSEADRNLARTGDAVSVAAHAFRQRARTATDPGLLWARTGFVTALDRVPVTSDDDAELTMLTSDHETGSLVVVRIDRHDNVHRETLTDVPFQGTTILASLPMPHHPQSSLDDGDVVSGGLAGARTR